MRERGRGRGPAAALGTLTLLTLLSLPSRAAPDSPAIELRTHWDSLSPASQGPLAEAHRLQPSIAPSNPSAAYAEAELRHTLRSRLAGQPLALGVDLLAWHQRPEGAAAASRARVNELHLETDIGLANAQGAWSLSAGKKVLGWDVGYGFRPNDVVQQETRRTQLSTYAEGRPLIALEHFDADSASTLVWVNPQHLNSAASRTQRAAESALAGRWYRRDGAVDWHAFGRWGEHTRASVGGAVAWVAGEETELHASARVMQRHDGWASRLGDPAAPTPSTTNPWGIQTLGGTTQWLLGVSWTGAQQQSLLVEAWHDGTAPSNAQWDQWRSRNLGLAASRAPAAAWAGNLAWQATPFDSTSLRQDNLFVRAAWQPEALTEAFSGSWTLSLDALLHPADRGHIVTAGLQWQGERLRINASWRTYGGPAGAVLAQLPQRRSGLIAATWSF